MDLAALGQALRARRVDRGIKASALAKRIGIGRNTLWRVERGRDPETGRSTRPAKDKLELWIAALGFAASAHEELLNLAGYDAGRGRPGTSLDGDGGEVTGPLATTPALHAGAPRAAGAHQSPLMAPSMTLGDEVRVLLAQVPHRSRPLAERLIRDVVRDICLAFHDET